MRGFVVVAGVDEQEVDLPLPASHSFEGVTPDRLGNLRQTSKL